MGIENFYTFLKNSYPGCFLQCSAKNVYDYIYIDCNHLLYNSMNGVKTRMEFLLKLEKYLDLLFSNFIATKKVLIAIDGASSYSKILLQRKRRQNSEIDNKTIKNGINSLLITPGTDFMKEVNDYLANYTKKIESKYKFIKPKFILSPTTEPDEGEIKIFKNININSKLDKDYSHLVIGNDADLIVLAMSMELTDKIHILIRHQRETELISIEKLSELYYEKINKICNKRLNFKSDFTLISTLMGDDYLPKLSYVRYDNIWKAYYDTIKEAKKPLLNGMGFDHEVIKLFFNNIIKYMPQQFKRMKLKNNPNINDQVINYLEGLLWCYRMYNTGNCPMYDYIYRYKSSPHSQYMLKFLEENKYKINIPYSSTPPINTDIYTLLVMPAKAKALIPKKYHRLMTKELKYMYDRENCNICKGYRENLSKFHKKMFSDKKNNIDTTDIRKKIGSVHSDLSKHKKKHNKEFSPTDIKKIIQLTQKIK